MSVSVNLNSDVINDIQQDLKDEFCNELTDSEFSRICNNNRNQIDKLVKLGILKRESASIRDNNVGTSNYSEHLIQPWSIWLDYPELNSWDNDIIKRILRTKVEKGLTITESRKLDYEKIIHICQERIRQINEGYE